MTTLSDDDWLDDQFDRVEERQARQTYVDPLAPNPEEESAIRALSEASGLPDTDVRANPDQAQRAADGRRASEILASNPRLGSWIADPRNGNVARDDIETLSIFERLARDPTAQLIGQQAALLFAPGLAIDQIRRGGVDPRPQFRQGELDVELGKLGARAGRARLGRGAPLSAEEQARLDELQAREGSDDWGPFILGPTARLAPQVLGGLERAGRQTVRRTDEALTDVYGDEAERREIARKVLSGDAGEAGRAALLAPVAGVATAVGGFGGFTGGYLGFGNEQEFGSAYVEYLRSGVDPDIAARQAENYSIWATALEFVGDALGLRLSGLGRLAGRAFAGRGLAQPGAAPAFNRALGAIAATSVDQGAEEASQELAQIIHKDLAQQETQTGETDVGTAWSKVLTPEAIAQILHAGYIGAQGGVGFAAIPSSVNLGLDLREIAAADRNAAIFEQQAEAARKSALGQRLPSALESAVGAMDSGEVFIDADRFVEHFQSAGADPFEVANQLGIGEDRLSQALAAHGQVSMPTARFAARVLRVPAHARLAEHARRSPTDATPAERETQLAVLKQRIEDVANEAQAAAQDNEIGAIVETRVKELLDNAYREGGTNPQVNKRYAALVRAVAQTLSKRSRGGEGDYAQRVDRYLRSFFERGYDVRGPAREGEARETLRGAEPMRAAATPEARRARLQELVDEELEADGEALEQADFDESERVRAAAEKAGGAMREIQERTLERGAPLDDRQQFSTGRREPPTQLPEPDTPEWEEQTREALALPHTERTPVQRALVRFFREEEARARQDEAGRVGPPDSVLRGVMDEEGELDQSALAPENVVSEPVPGETASARRYGFAVGNEHVIVNVIPESDRGHAALIEWTFLGRLRRHEATYQKGSEKLSRSETQTLLDGVADIVTKDMAEMNRPAYVFTPYTEAHRRAYQAMLGRMDLPEGYSSSVVEGDVYVHREDIDISPNGEVLYLDPDRPPEPFAKESASDADLQARDNAFYDKVEALRPARATSDRGGGQRTGGPVGEGGQGAGPAAAPDSDGELFQSRENDRLGFVSIALEAAKALPDRAMRGEEAINRILKARGVSGMTGRVSDEVDYLGLREEFGGKKSVTKEELIDWIRSHMLVGALIERYNRFDPRAPAQDTTGWRAELKADRWQVYGPDGALIDTTSRQFDTTPEAAIQAVALRIALKSGTSIGQSGAGIRRGPGDLRLPGDEPVFELRIKIPEFGATDTARRAVIGEELKAAIPSDLTAIEYLMDAPNGSSAINIARKYQVQPLLEELREIDTRRLPGSDFESHWSRPPSNDLGVLVSVRGEERVDDKGQRTLFGGEVQSDLAQQVRRSLSEFAAQQQAIAEDTTTAPAGWGVAGDVGAQPDRAAAAERAKQAFRQMQAPLASKTSQWTGAAVRAILYRAARDGFDSVSFPTGETSKLIQGNDSAAAHYDTNVKGAAEKVARAMGGEVRRGHVAFDASDSDRVATLRADLELVERSARTTTNEERRASFLAQAESLRAALAASETKQASAYVLDITPEMRSRIVKEGLPLFQSDAAQEAAQKEYDAATEAAQKKNDEAYAAAAEARSAEFDRLDAEAQAVKDKAYQDAEDAAEAEYAEAERRAEAEHPDDEAAYDKAVARAEAARDNAIEKAQERADAAYDKAIEKIEARLDAEELKAQDAADEELAAAEDAAGEAYEKATGLTQSRSREGKRGSILLDRFANDGSLRAATINLFEASDLSTFLHESGHLFLEILQAVSLDEQAPQELKDMWASTQNWFGLQPGQWQSMTLEQRRNYHELWARTFEQYLMEGKAPSLGLREAFAAFKAWLMQIYRTVMRLDSNLTPEIRDVFDRLLATEQEMAEARAAAGVDKGVFATREESGMSEPAWAQYQEAIAGAREAQEAELRARVMETYTRKQKRWWRSERARIRPTVEREVDSDPARRAHDWLAFNEWRDLPAETDEDGNVVEPTPAEGEFADKPEDLPPMKLSAQALVDDYGEGIFNELPPALRPGRPEDIEAALANAMALKKQGKTKRPLRLAGYVRSLGGINTDTLSEEDRATLMAAIGDPRKRPGLINNKTGKAVGEVLDAAYDAGYFGQVRKAVPRAPGEQEGLFQAPANDVGFWRRLFGPRDTGVDSAQAFEARSTRGNDPYPTAAEYWRTEWGDEKDLAGIRAPMTPANVDQPITKRDLNLYPRIKVDGVELGATKDYVRYDGDRWTAGSFARLYLQKFRGDVVQAIAYAEARDRPEVAKMLAFWRTAGRIEVFVGPQELSQDELFQDEPRRPNLRIVQDEGLGDWREAKAAVNAYLNGRWVVKKEREGSEMSGAVWRINAYRTDKESGDAIESFPNYRDGRLVFENIRSRTQQGALDKAKEQLRAWARTTIRGEPAPRLPTRRELGAMMKPYADAMLDEAMSGQPVTTQIPEQMLDAHRARREEAVRRFRAVYGRFPGQAIDGSPAFDSFADDMKEAHRLLDEGPRLTDELFQEDGGAPAALRATILDASQSWRRRRSAAEAFIQSASKAEAIALAKEISPGSYQTKQNAAQAILGRLSQQERDAVMAVRISHLPRFQPGSAEMRAWIAENPERMAAVRREAAARFLQVDDDGNITLAPEGPQELFQEDEGGGSVSPMEDLKARDFTLELYHKTAGDFEEFKPFQHFGTVAQANMRAVGQGANIRPVLVRGTKWKRKRDTGSWREADLRRLQRQGFDGVVYLNRYEGIPLEEFEAARARGIDVDALSDAQFKKAIPSASESYIVFDPKNVVSRLSDPSTARGPAGQEEMFSDSTNERPTPRELLDSLIADLRNERAVYSIRDADAVASNQEREDMVRWFESRGIDLTKNKDEIRTQIAAALDREADDPNAVSPDIAASWFGMSSGDELIQALRGLKPRAQAIEEGIDARLEAEYGDIWKDGSITEAARQAANVETQANVLELELAAIERAAGGRVTPVNRAARQFAERAVNNMSVREVRGYDKFLAGERRAAQNAIAALKKGDFQQAALHQSRRIASFWMYRLARAAAEETDRIQRYLRKFDNEGTRKAFLPDGARHLDQIDQVLEAIDLRAKPYPGARARASFKEYLAQLENEGIDVDDIVELDPAFLEAIRRREFAALSMEEVRGLRDVVQNFDQLGRRWNRVLTDRKNRQLNEVIEGLVERAEQEYPKRAHIVPSLASRSKIEQAVDLAMDLHGSMVKAEQLFRFMDGLKANGPWFSAFMPAAQRAESAKVGRMIAETERFKSILSVYSKKELGKMLLKKEFIPEIADNLTKMQQIGVALNVGNAYNREHMMEGFQWSEQQLQAVLRRLDERDWKFVQSVWDFLGSFKGESFALDERVRGVRPEEVEPLPVQTRFGTLPGGYFPVKFDPKRSRRAAKREAKESVEQMSGGSYRQIGTKRGRLKQRVGTAGQAFRLDPISIISEHVEETVHDLTHREFVIDARRLIASERVAAAVRGVLGPWGVKVLDNWIAKVEQPKPRVMEAWERLAAKAKNNATIVSMGLKVTTALIQELGALNAIPRTGILPMLKQKGITVARDYPEFLARQTARLFGAPETLPARFEFIFDRSDFMKHRMTQFDRDVRDAMATKLGERPGILPQVPKVVQDKMMVLSQLMDMAVAGPAWLAGYESALAGKVDGIAQGDEQAAIEHADSIVRTTQSGGAPKDLSSILASDNQFWRLATLFMNWASGFYNQMFVEQIPGVLAGKISPARFAANMLFIWFLPALATIWFYGRLEPQDDEDEEERNARVALETAMYPLQTIPILRDAINAAVTGYDYSATPAQAAIEAPIKLTRAAQRGDSEEVVKQGLMTAGYAAGLPSRQLWITGEGLTDIVTGEEDVTEDPIGSASELLIRDTR